MSKQKGFTVVEIVLGLVVLCLIGYIGYTAWQSMSKQKTDQASQQTTQKKAVNKNQPAEPYADWKEYCSTSGGYCFKHPSGWAITDEETVDPTIKAARLTPPSSDFTIEYNPFLSGIGGMVDPGTAFFTAFSIKKTPNVDGTSVVQGAFINKAVGNEYSPMWFVIQDEDIEKYYPLKVDQAVDVGFFVATFAQSEGGAQTFGIRTQKTFTTLDAAREWFKRGDLRTAGLVLESLSKKN